MKDYYEILEIGKNATTEEIEKAYKTLVTKYNPDNFKGDAREIVQKKIDDVKESYSILSDEILRKEYDKDIEQGKKIENIREEYKNKIPKEEKNQESKKNKKIPVGSWKSISGLAKDLMGMIPKIKLRKPSKKGALSLLAAVVIVLLIGVLLWFIPFTNGFMRSFLVMN